jgi:hypothetical protein
LPAQDCCYGSGKEMLGCSKSMLKYDLHCCHAS